MYRYMPSVTFGLSLFVFLVLSSCAREEKPEFTGAAGEVKLMTLDPGHFHAALVQKTMYDQVDPVVHVFAPAGPDVEDHLMRIEGFNTRPLSPTRWDENVYTGPDYLEKMTEEKPGNVVIISGNNRKKTEYIKAAVDSGLNVLADKPMCIDAKGFELLKEAFESAKRNNVLLYDIMTERHEISTVLQKELAGMGDLFGRMEKGSPDDPAVTKESVHHFFKYVSGNPIKRPPWYLDITQQGEGLVDVTTHLVDLVQWECFPEKSLDYERDIEMLTARRWPTKISREQFEKVTRLPDFPYYLTKDIGDDDLLYVFSNGEMIYRVRGVHAKVSVIWNFEAPEGGGDTHFSVMRGTKANLIIRQGKEQNYRPELYVEPVDDTDIAVFEKALERSVDELQNEFPGVGLEDLDGSWRVLIPDEFRLGHEAHFGQVTEKYLGFLVEGKLPEWEVPNMIAKYYTTTLAREASRTR